MKESTEIIGLIPAAGRASRLAGLPFSKELLPLDKVSPIPKGTGTPRRVAIDHALDTMTAAGISDTCVVIAPGKWDIPAHTGDGGKYGQSIAFVLADASPSVPASLDKAWFLTRHRDVALLFPDIIFVPQQALKSIIEQRRKTRVDLVLALVPATGGEKVDIVSISGDGSIDKVTPKPGKDYSGWTWVAATWNPDFSRFLHRCVAEAGNLEDRELYVADIINAAIDAGLTVGALYFPSGQSFDLGTPVELEEFWNSAILQTIM